MSIEETLQQLGSAVSELDALIAHEADPRDMALAAEEATFYSAELCDLSVRLRRAVSERELAV